MASAHAIPSLSAQQNSAMNQVGQASSGENAQALIAVGQNEPEPRAAISLGRPLAILPVELDVAVPVREFRVRNLLALDCGQVIETQWGHGEDVPLASGEVQLAWSEFEVVDSQLGVRVTRLA
jgi:flagellar motor switch/type III secretory pathway protein FliN